MKELTDTVIHWDSLTFYNGRFWFIVTVPIHEVPALLQEKLIQIEDSLSMELTLPAYTWGGEVMVVWPTGDGESVKLLDMLKAARTR